MPIDTSMYGMIKPVDAIGSLEKGMKMRDLIDERKKKSAVQDAFKQGLKVGPDGKMSMDHNMTASALAQGGYGQEAYEAQQQGQLAQQKQMEQAVKHAQYGAQVLGAARNQGEWDAGLQQLQNNGMDVAKLPAQYSPDSQKFLVDSAMTLGDRLNEQWKQKEFNAGRQDKTDARDFELAKLGIVQGHDKNMQGRGFAHQERMEILKAVADKSFGGLSEGEKKVDQDYAKDYNDFTGGGYAKAEDALAKLENLKTNMVNDNGVFQAGGGPISGSMPDAFRTQASIAQRDNIVSVANSALKATFGGQLSDGERKALANEFYNDKLSNAENIKIIETKIGELRNSLAANAAKAKHFQANRSLKGFQYEGIPYVKTKPPGGPKSSGLIDEAQADGPPAPDFDSMSDEQLKQYVGP